MPGTDPTVSRARWVITATVAVVAALWWWQQGAVESAQPQPITAEPAATLSAPVPSTAANAQARAVVPATPGAADGVDRTGPGEVRVLLTWADDDTPVVGHEVIATDPWYTPRPRSIARAVSDAAGVARMELAAGRYHVLALHRLGRSVEVRAGESVELPLPLPRDGVLEGRVVDENDLPVANATVHGVRGGLVGSTIRVATSAADGTFRASLPCECFVFARKVGHGASAAVYVEFAGPTVPIELVVAAATTSLRGRVVDQGNRPIADARVFLGAPHPLPRSGEYVEPGDRPEVRTDADGAFAFADVPPGEGGCYAVAPGFRRGGAEFVARLGEVADVRVVLGPGARVAGRVVDADGRGVPGVGVQAGRFEQAEVRTDASGRFLLDVEPGRVELVAVDADAGAGRTEVDAVAGATIEAEITVRAEPTCAGRVVDETGAPLPGLWVRLSARDPRAFVPFSLASTDLDGHFELRACPEGPMKLRVTAGLGQGQPLAVVQPVRAGEAPCTIVVRAETRPSAFVVLRVEDPAHPRRRMHLMAQNLETTAEEHVFPMPGELARIGPLPPGSWRVRHLHAADPEQPVLGLELGPISLGVGEERDLGTHTLAPASELLLTLVRGGEPAVGSQPRPLRLVPLPDGAPIAAMLQNGEVYPFAFRPGRYRLEARAGVDHAAASAEVEFVAGRSTTLRLELPPLRPCRLRLRPAEGEHPPYRGTLTLHGPDGATREEPVRNGIARLGLRAGTYRARIAGDGCAGETTFTVDSELGAELHIDIAAQR